MVGIAIVVLTLTTAAVHASFFIRDPQGGVIYGLNALGYVTLLAALYLPIPGLRSLRRPIRWLLIGFAGVTIVAYVVFGLVTGDWTVPLGPITKLIEVTLIVLLVVEDRRRQA